MLKEITWHLWFPSFASSLKGELMITIKKHIETELVTIGDSQRLFRSMFFERSTRSVNPSERDNQMLGPFRS